MSNIMYIHGLGSTANGGNTIRYLRENFRDDNIYSYDIPIDPVAAVKLLKEKVKENNINLIVSTSLGSFYSMMIPNVKRIIINPCVMPSIEIPKISPIGITNDYYYPRADGINTYTITNDIIAGYKKLEDDLINILNDDSFKNNSYFIFGINDEHFSYIEYIKKYINDNHIFICNSKHRLSSEDADSILKPLIIKNK